MKVINGTAGLNEKCDMIASSCLEIHPFKTAKTTVKAKLDGKLVNAASFEICDTKKRKSVYEKILISLFGLNGKCGLNETIIFCDNDRKFIQFSKGAEIIYNIGNSRTNKVITEVNSVHENGKTCVILEHYLYKI